LGIQLIYSTKSNEYIILDLITVTILNKEPTPQTQNLPKKKSTRYFYAPRENIKNNEETSQNQLFFKYKKNLDRRKFITFL